MLVHVCTYSGLQVHIEEQCEWFHTAKHEPAPHTVCANPTVVPEHFLSHELDHEERQGSVRVAPRGRDTEMQEPVASTPREWI